MGLVLEEGLWVFWASPPTPVQLPTTAVVNALDWLEGEA